jgi:hypothetical protein
LTGGDGSNRGGGGARKRRQGPLKASKKTKKPKKPQRSKRPQRKKEEEDRRGKPGGEEARKKRKRKRKRKRENEEEKNWSDSGAGSNGGISGETRQPEAVPIAGLFSRSPGFLASHADLLLSSPSSVLRPWRSRSGACPAGFSSLPQWCRGLPKRSLHPGIAR